MLVAGSRLAWRALMAGAALAAVLLLWGMHQADAKEPPPLLDLGGGGIGIDVPPIGPIDLPPINVGGAPDAPSPAGNPSAPESTPAAVTNPVAEPIAAPIPTSDPSSPAVGHMTQPVELSDVAGNLADALGRLVPPLAPVLDLVDHAVLQPLTEGLDRAVDELVGPIVAIVPRPSPTPAGAVAATQANPPAAVPPPDPGAPATQSLASDASGGPGIPGPPGGRAPPEPVGAPGPPLGTTGSTTSSNGNRLDAGLLVLGLVLALLLGFRPRDEAWWYAGVYQLEPLTSPG